VAGRRLTLCPGARAPTYVCLGGRGKACPLATDADAVVLDAWLPADVMRLGVPSWHLLLYYSRLGLPVVFLVGPDGAPGPAPDASVIMLPRTASAPTIANALEAVLEHRAGRLV